MLSWPVHHSFESREDTAPPRWRKFFFPNPRLKHDFLKEEAEGFVRRKSNFLSYFISKDKIVAFNSRSVPRNATDKMSLARFPTSSATLKLEESREGAPRILGRPKSIAWPENTEIPPNFGPSQLTAQARFSTRARGQNLGLEWSSDSSLWETKYKR